MLARAGRLCNGKLGGFLTQQPRRTVVYEDHHIYRPTDGEPITFSVFVTEDPWGDFDITRSIIMLPSWFGPTDDVKEVAQEFASNTNWRVFLPDIYGSGVTASTVEEAQDLYSKLDYTQTIHDVGWLARKLRQFQPGSGICTIGFSAGGAMALEAAACSDDIACAASFYGLPPQQNWEDLIWAFKKNNKPMHLQFGLCDSVFDWSEAEQFRQLLKTHDNKFQFYAYPTAGHSFMEGPEAQELMGQPAAGGVLDLATIRASKFLLENTPKLSLDALPEEFDWFQHFEESPNNPEDVGNWKEY